MFQSDIRWFTSTLKHFWHLNISSILISKTTEQTLWSLLYFIPLPTRTAGNNLLIKKKDNRVISAFHGEVDISTWFTICVQESSGSQARARIKSTYKHMKQVKQRWFDTNTSSFSMVTGGKHPIRANFIAINLNLTSFSPTVGLESFTFVGSDKNHLAEIRQEHNPR